MTYPIVWSKVTEKQVYWYGETMWFLEECTMPSKGGYIKKTDLYKFYVQYMRVNEYGKPDSRTYFDRSLKNVIGLQEVKSPIDTWANIKMKPNPYLGEPRVTEPVLYIEG